MSPVTKISQAFGRMPLSAVVIDVPADAIAIAARFQRRPGFAFLHDASGRGGRSFVAADPVETSSGFVPPADLAVAAPGDTRAAVPRWIGAIPYEAGRAIERASWTRAPDDRPPPDLRDPIWQRYGAVVEVEEGRGMVRVIGDDPGRVDALAAQLGRKVEPFGRPMEHASSAPLLIPFEPDDAPSEHLRRVRRAQELIRAGDLYQVNLARRLRFSVRGEPFELYRRLAQRTHPAFGACLRLGSTVVCATSPELFLHLDPFGHVRTAPIKGTRPRGHDAPSDERRARELTKNLKEQAELTMILDVERNDLGKVAALGSVRLLSAPYVQTHPTLHHRLGVLGARLAPGKSARDLLAATFPSGSVTGAPKVRAMEVIAELEPVRRGLYTGAFGWIGFDGSVELAMAIRVLTIQNEEAHYFAGGGIVADSDPEAELTETYWKGAQLEALASGGKLA